jgi:hypothetical protein
MTHGLQTTFSPGYTAVPSGKAMTSSVTFSCISKGTGGCKRKASEMTAFVYGQYAVGDVLEVRSASDVDSAASLG